MRNGSRNINRIGFSKQALQNIPLQMRLAVAQPLVGDGRFFTEPNNGSQEPIRRLLGRKLIGGLDPRKVVHL